ncbi:hypothetical protein K435DRAFT_877771, partial [Dendrothele bispora CBS 962.96]
EFSSSSSSSSSSSDGSSDEGIAMVTISAIKHSAKVSPKAAQKNPSDLLSLSLSSSSSSESDSDDERPVRSIKSTSVDLGAPMTSHNMPGPIPQEPSSPPPSIAIPSFI